MVRTAAVIAAVMLALAAVPIPVTDEPAPVEPVKAELTEMVSLGEFTCTAYCGCRKCNGKWYGYPTASGTDYEEGRTLAVDPKVIPLGTEIYIPGWGWFVAEDTGNGIKGQRLDMYYDDHGEALEHGVKQMEVWVKDGAM